MSRMNRFDWLSRQACRRSHTFSHHDRRLRVEALEDRRLLSLAPAPSNPLASGRRVRVAYRLRPNFYLGLEFRHQSDYLNPQEDGEFNPELRRSSFDLFDFRVGSQHQRGNYLGPTAHYATKEWWVTGGVLWQVRGGGSPFSYSRNHRNFDEHEKVHVGLVFGYEFD